VALMSSEESCKGSQQSYFNRCNRPDRYCDYTLLVRKSETPIYISSLPGWSAAGLAIIDKDLETDLALHAVSEFCAPTVDYSAAVQFSNGKATSLCDISDALVIQAEQIASASQVQLSIEKDLISQAP